MDPSRSFMPPMSNQFRPVVPGQQSQQFIQAAPPHFQSVGRGVSAINNGLPSPQVQQPQFPQLMQQLPARPGQGLGPPPSQATSLPNAPPSMHVASGSPLPMPNVQAPNNYMPGFGGPGTPLLSSYTFAPSSYGQRPVTFNAMTHYQPISQMHAPTIPAGGQPGLSPVNQIAASVIPLHQSVQQSAVSSISVRETNLQTKLTEQAPTDWIEHTSANGKRYYHNKRTRQSSWVKPVELMTPVERADASTDWKEFTSPDGRKYYYNKVTKQSKWEIPEELKLARERVGMRSEKETQQETSANPHGLASVTPLDEAPSTMDVSAATAQGATSSPVAISPVGTSDNIQSGMIAESSALPVEASPVIDRADGAQGTLNTVPPSAGTSGSSEAAVTMVDVFTAPMNDSCNIAAEDVPNSADGFPAEDKEEASTDVMASEKAELEDKVVDQEHTGYVDKLEAKSSFKSLLESANVGSDWTWEQAMRVIINDKRYGALRTLGERKQAFNEFLGQKKKREVEERRIKQKKAREEFTKMLEESTELTSSTRWSKAMVIFENDERFKGVERERDRRDLFESYLEELGKKERVKAQEERKSNIMEYREYLESCDFIKASTQWRKVQDRLEADERCSRLEKIDRLEIFQDYVRDLEKEEEEQRRKQKEDLRKAERKKRDEFRKLMEEHLSAGALTAKTHWRDYYLKVKDLPAYLDVASNTSGPTPKDLFEDVAEELEKQYHDDKTRIKDAVKLKKVALSSSWTLEEFRASIAEEIGSPPISDVNLKLILDELLERVREKEEKEAKKRKRLADDFRDLLHSIKEINASSRWENSKELFQGSREYSSIGVENFCREIFEEYITELQEQAMEDDRKRKEKVKKEKDREGRDRKKSKHRREKDRGHDREKEQHLSKDGGDIEIADTTEVRGFNEDKRSESDNSKKQRNRHEIADNSNDGEKDRSKNSNKHNSDHKKSRRHVSTPESDGESKRKRHKRDHRNGSRNGHREDLEDGEYGNDGQNTVSRGKDSELVN
ncbi:pre-mRNA-processing protein 40A-like isoform X3 [Tripterygium wilfordii]|uniref:pre-mRNA-processing protein 40A-like isoform X3 n=1 Tax=Tripterygium wilfordii TaxID=458696 RepID=UPI0018F84023|nr:pre-mRNA-processing protein 40A-like isoform X3 [Tripterygium wilfordii]